jgi:hypothetical protein
MRAWDWGAESRIGKLQEIAVVALVSPPSKADQNTSSM